MSELRTIRVVTCCPIGDAEARALAAGSRVVDRYELAAGIKLELRVSELVPVSAAYVVDVARSSDVRRVDRCAPLCAASKAYGRFDQPWKHDRECPVRVAWEESRGAAAQTPDLTTSG